MVPVLTLTTSPPWTAKAPGNFSVQPLPMAALSGRLKSSAKPTPGAITAKDRALLVTSPALGVKTVTSAVPAVAMSDAGMAAVSWAVEPKVVDRFAPFHRTTESRTKFCPSTVSVKPAPPATADAGLMLSMAIEPLPGPALYVMSSTPRSHPAVKATVTVVEACTQPVDTSCIVPTETSCVLVWPRLSVSVSVPAVPENTRILFSTWGPGEKLNEREVPELDAK